MNIFTVNISVHLIEGYYMELQGYKRQIQVIPKKSQPLGMLRANLLKCKNKDKLTK